MITKIPQVILLGNGINRAYGKASWNEFLKEISDGSYKDIDKLNCPMPFKAILVTNDTIDKKLAKYVNTHYDESHGTICDERLAQTLQSILTIGADHILTTNYSYELEYATQKSLKISDSMISKWQSHTEYVKQSDGKYLLYTYNKVKYEGIENKIWHIHGEVRKPSSVVLGHCYYSEILHRIVKFAKDAGPRYWYTQKNDKEWHLRSWIDAFIMGDVYIIGTKLDLSEIDLWWLINRKKREKAEHGKLYFYEPVKEPCEDAEIDVRLELIKIFAEVKNMGVEIPKKIQCESQFIEEKNDKYREFYVRAIADIAEKIHNKSAENQ